MHVYGYKLGIGCYLAVDSQNTCDFWCTYNAGQSI